MCRCCLTIRLRPMHAGCLLRDSIARQPDPLSLMRIEIDDLSRPQVHALLSEHLANMYELSPPENVHALDLSKLRAPGITFWTVWDGVSLLGCGALKQLSATHGEVKSMRTPQALRRRGAGRAVLEPHHRGGQAARVRDAQPGDRLASSLPVGTETVPKLRLLLLRVVWKLPGRPQQCVNVIAPCRQCGLRTYP